MIVEKTWNDLRTEVFTSAVKNANRYRAAVYKTAVRNGRCQIRRNQHRSM